MSELHLAGGRQKQNLNSLGEKKKKDNEVIKIIA